MQVGWLPAFGLVSMAAYPFLRIAAHNLGLPFDFKVAAQWFVVTVTCAMGLVAFVGRIIPGSTGRVAVCLIPCVWLLFNFHVFDRGSSRPELLWMVTAASVVGAVWIAGKRVWVQNLMAIWAILLAVAYLTPIVAYSPEPLIGDFGEVTLFREAVDRPNVWVFVPDGYTSAEEVRKQTGVDISSFIAALRERGFKTPDVAANYPKTYLSVSSMLDQELLAVDGDEVQEREPFYERIQGSNRTVDQFRTWGYEYVFATTSSWDGSLCSGVEDICLTGEVMTRTNQAILSVTPFESWVELSDDTASVINHSDPSYVVDRVLKAAPPEPYLVISHLMEPHPPEFRTADCDIRPDAHIAIHDAKWDATRYGETVQCLNQQFVEAVDRIIEEDPDSVVVLQADHGTHHGRNYDPQPSERYEVMSALKLPCQVADEMAMVDVMGVVTSCLAGQDPELSEYERFSVSDHIVSRSDE